MNSRSALVLSGLLLSSMACGGEKAAPAASPAPAAPRPNVVATAPAPTATAPAAPKPSMVELQRKTLLAQAAAIGAGDAKARSETYAEDAVLQHSVSPAGWAEVHGRAAIAAAAEEMKTKATFTTPTIVRAVQKDDAVVYEWIMSGTDKASNKKFTQRGVSIAWFDDAGLVKKERGYTDPITMAVQIGMLPGVARTTAPFTGETTWLVAKNDDAEAKNVELVKNSWPVSWPKKDKKAWESAITDDFVEEQVASPVDAKGKTAAVASMTTLTKAFPDLAVTVDSSWAAGDVVAFEFTMTGTQKGSLGIIPPTGKKVSLHGLDVVQTKDGKLAHATTYTSSAELLAQVGLMPAKPPAAKTGAPAKK